MNGPGEVVFDGVGTSVIGHGLVVDSALTIAADMTVRTGTGSGSLGGGRDRPITNHGAVRSQTAGERIDLSGSDFTNHGAIAASNGGEVSVWPTAFSNTSVVSAAGTDSTVSINAINGWSNAAGGTGTVVFNATANGAFRPSGAIRPARAGSVLTLGPGITVQTGTGGGTIGAEPLETINQGIISSRTAGQSITLTGTFSNEGTVEVRNGGRVTFVGWNSPVTAVANYADGTLTGGRWAVHAGSTLTIGMSAAVTTNAADVVLHGDGSEFAAIESLGINRGSFSILDGRDFTTTGALTNAGRIVAGAGSDLSVAGDLSVAADAMLAVELFEDDEDSLAEGFGQYDVADSAFLDGTLAAFLAAGHSVAPGDTFTFLTAASITGTFDAAILPPGMAADVVYSPTSVRLRVIAVPEPGAPAVLFLAAAAGLRRRRRGAGRVRRRGTSSHLL